eukprot:2819587-Pyramimonas_sp.AAC.1
MQPSLGCIRTARCGALPSLAPCRIEGTKRCHQIWQSHLCAAASAKKLPRHKQAWSLTDDARTQEQLPIAAKAHGTRSHPHLARGLLRKSGGWP